MDACRSGWAACLIGTLFALFVPSHNAVGQRPVRLEDRDTCEQCRIRLRKLATLGDTAGAGIIDPSEVVWVRDSRGTYYHTGTHIGPEIRVFDEHGRFRQLLGRRGGGPGELNLRSALFVGAGDTLHVFNAGNRSYFVFDPQLRLVRSRPAPLIPNTVLESPNGDFVVSAQLRTREAIGFPLHRVSRAGDYIAGFGTNDPYLGPGAIHGARRLVGRPAGKTFFSLHVFRLVIEEWSWDGALLQTFTAEPRWFQPIMPPDGQFTVDGSVPFPVMLAGGKVDEQGLLWLVYSIPDRNWRDAFHVHGTPGPHGPIPSDVHLWDSMILVIDPVRRRVVKRVRSDRWIGGFVGEHAVANILTGMGHPQVEIMAIELVR